MWCESSLQIGDQDVRLCVERLEGEVRDRTAAVLAWLTLEAARDEVGGMAAWHEYVGDLLHRHTSFVVPGLSPADDLGAAWWHEAVGRAFVQFVSDNDLAPAINSHLARMQTAGAAWPQG